MRLRYATALASSTVLALVFLTAPAFAQSGAPPVAIAPAAANKPYLGHQGQVMRDLHGVELTRQGLFLTGQGIGGPPTAREIIRRKIVEQIAGEAVGLSSANRHQRSPIVKLHLRVGAVEQYHV